MAPRQTATLAIAITAGRKAHCRRSPIRSLRRYFFLALEANNDRTLSVLNGLDAGAAFVETVVAGELPVLESEPALVVASCCCSLLNSRMARSTATDEVTLGVLLPELAVEAAVPAAFMRDAATLAVTADGAALAWAACLVAFCKSLMIHSTSRAETVPSPLTSS